MSLKVQDVTVRRGTRTILEPLSLTAHPGEVLAILGPNGAGKSTLLRAILGLLPSDGSLTWNGRDLRKMSVQDRAQILAYVPQRSGLESALTVTEVVTQGRYAAHTPDTQAVHEALVKTDLTDFAERSFLSLSLGEQQRVLLARALASGAPAILLDEPTAALDIGHALDFTLLLTTLAAEGRTIIAVLHDLEEVHRTAHRVVLLERGRLRTHGPTEEVLTEEHLREVFGVVPVTSAWGVRRL